MSRKVMEAAQLAENQLLTELMENYQAMLYSKWLIEHTPTEAILLRARAQAANDINKWIQNKCAELINHDT